VEAVLGVAVAALRQVCHGRVGRHRAGPEKVVTTERRRAQQKGREICTTCTSEDIRSVTKGRAASPAVEMAATLLKLFPVLLFLFVAVKMRKLFSKIQFGGNIIKEM